MFLRKKEPLSVNFSIISRSVGPMALDVSVMACLFPLFGRLSFRHAEGVCPASVFTRLKKVCW